MAQSNTRAVHPIAKAVSHTNANNANKNTNTKRKRPTKACISPNSPLFNAVQKIRNQTDFNLDQLTNYKDEWLKFGLTNIITPNTTLYKLEHTIHRPPPKFYTTNNRPYNKFKRERQSKRRATPYFRSNYYRSIWIENNETAALEVSEIIKNVNLYPIYLTVQRLVKPVMNGVNDSRGCCNPPPAKRLKTDSSANVSANGTKNDVICLLDSSDEEDDATPVTPVKAGSQPNQQVICLDSPTNAPPDNSQIKLTPTYQPPPDPIPNSYKASDNADFVLTPYGAGKIIASRVERHASTSGTASILKPTIIYTIDLHFGICHLPSSQVKTISGTSYVSRTLLTYNKVPITGMDLLRLRPMTYLNDSIVNFYLKYLKFKSEQENISNIDSKGREWDDLDGEGVYIFPSFCYNQIVNIMGSDNKNTKANRLKIWKDLKSWTKGTDIFKKRMLVFPVNYNLHWTAVFVFHPGRLIRKYAPESTGLAQGRADSTVGGSQGLNGVISAPKTLPTDQNNLVSSSGPSGTDTKQTIGDAVFSTVRKCITDMINQVASPLRKPKPSPDAIQCMSTLTTTKPVSTEPNVAWQCDFCLLNFKSYSKACAHEKKCPKNIDYCMLHFDSGKHFKLHNSQTITGYIRKYLSAYYDSEYESTHPNVGPLTQLNMPGYTSAVPQQDNTKDCGVYMLEIVEQMLANPPVVDREFVKKNCKVFAKDLFGKDVIEKKRDDILQLVHALRVGEDVEAKL